MNVNYFEDEVTFSRQFRLTPEADFVGLVLDYMACDKSMCIFPDPIGIRVSYENGILTGFEPAFPIDLEKEGEEGNKQSTKESSVVDKSSTYDYAYQAEFQDLDEAMQAAQERNLPILVHFTGWACISDRKMEEVIWQDEKASKILRDEVVLVSLFVDDRTKLPKSAWRDEKFGGRDYPIRTLGNKWNFLQVSRFNSNAQPMYVMLDHSGEQIGGVQGYDRDPKVFVKFLMEGLSQLEKSGSETPKKE